MFYKKSRYIIKCSDEIEGYGLRRKGWLEI